MSKVTAFRNKGLLNAVVMFAIFAVSPQVTASAFAVKEQSVTHLGNAFAGTASSATDASTAFYNPAGLVELKHSQAVVSATYVMAKLKLHNASARNTINQAVVGNNFAKPKSRALIPGLFLSWRLDDSFTLGFSVSAPFGLLTKYTNTDITRYVATESKITTVMYSPTIGYKLNDQFSVGAGFDAMRVKATLAGDVFLGANEGYLINRAHGWAYGYHLGILYKPSYITKMGLTYFSKFDVRAKGLANASNFTSSPSTLITRVNLPDRLVYSVTHQYTDEWTAMGEIEWTHWSRLKSLRLDYNTGNPVTEYFFYKNSYRVSLGADYKYSQALTMKGGLAYDQSPIINAYRSARVPDSNRYWLAFGLKYMVNKNISIDGAYAHLFAKNAVIAQRAAAPSQAALNGNYKNSADIVGVQLTWNFV